MRGGWRGWGRGNVVNGGGRGRHCEIGESVPLRIKQQFESDACEGAEPCGRGCADTVPGQIEACGLSPTCVKTHKIL